jgi:3-deoxy-manno-octulosonate cytidylyltransferase (CMP-KDO synthetase)
MNIVAFIPARMGSSRFPGKPLAPLLGKPMIEHVYKRTAMAAMVDSVYIATCDEKIKQAAEGFGAAVVMTSNVHQRASDRIAEAVEKVAADADVIVMVQGDEPMISPEMVDESVVPFLADSELACTNLLGVIRTEDEFNDRNTIKVIRGGDDNALYFSREPIPTQTILGFGGLTPYKQVCIISFSRAGLKRFGDLAPTSLEQSESIDMMRFLEHGVGVRLVPTMHYTPAVDTPEDLGSVESLLRDDPLSRLY